MISKLMLWSALVAFASATVSLEEYFSWNALDWKYPNANARYEALNSGELIQANALPVGIERWGNKLFVSVPRWRPGIPATLNYIPLDASYEPSPKLLPYPSWQGNELGNCANGLNTVYRIKADRCDRLWVLDVGTYGYDPNVTNLCPYSLNVYDLHTDTRIRRYVFRPEDIVATTFIANLVLDERRTCDDTFAYMSDELGYGLIVYSWEQNRSWRFTHDFFRPDPLKGNFNIGGLNFQWGAEGIFGIATSPIGVDGYRTLYFSPLSSHTEFAISTRILRNESKVEDSYHDFKVVGSRGQYGHTTSHVMSERGIELFALIDQNAIGCWNSRLALKPQNTAVIDKDDVGLIFPCDVKIVDEHEVWVISDRMSTFLESPAGLDYSDINFRIYRGTLNSLLQGTVCEPTEQNIPIAQIEPYRQSLRYQNRPKLPSPLSSQPLNIPSGRNPLALFNQHQIFHNQPGVIHEAPQPLYPGTVIFPPQPYHPSTQLRTNIENEVANNKQWWPQRNYQVYE